MVTSEQLFTIAASAGFLGLAALAAFRGARNPLALPLALLCVDLFAYNGLEAADSSTASHPWKGLESAAAALAAPLLVHFTLAFLGARRTQRRFLFAVYAYFGLVVVSCLAPAVIPAMRDYPGGDTWALAMLAGILPGLGWTGFLLVRHYRDNTSAEERARTQLFIGTMAIGVGGVATDLLSIAGAPGTPRLAAWTMLLSAVLLTALALRFRLLRGTIALLGMNAALLGVVGVAAHLTVFRWLGRESALLVLGTVAVTLVLLGAARAVWSSFTTYRERGAHLATLGRLSAQMAHDIRNPLSAIRGAAQYLEVERERGGRLDDHGELLALIVEQTDRLERVVRDYRRLGRAEPVRTPVDVAALVLGVVESARVADLAGDAVQVTAEVDEALYEQPLDADLLATALENLARNAIEAMGEHGGHVILRAEKGFARGDDAIVLQVIDDGPGMDPRTREQAEEAFFTTKAGGTGLGLAFVRRVAEAHGGELRIQSRLGHGTTVTLVVPCDAHSSAG